MSIWPDPNSLLLSKIKFKVPVAELLLWLRIRDTLLGQNGKKQDVPFALALARDCNHPDAVWLSSVCQDVSTTEQAREIFLSIHDDPRALCFAWHMSKDRVHDFSLLLRATEMKNAFAAASI